MSPGGAGDGPLSWAPELDEDAPRPPGLPPFATGPGHNPAPSGSDGPSTAVALAREIPILVIAAVVVAFLLRTFVFQAFFIPSPSMGCKGCPVETLAIDDKILVSKLAYKLHEPHRGDIVVFDCPPTAQCVDRAQSATFVGRALRWTGERIGVIPPSTEDYVKRVIGLPGESIEIRDGLVYVDGQPLIEPYLPPTIVTTASASLPQPYVVPAGHLWVMGDNRPNSSDSRVFQAITIDSVVGRAVAIFWPLPRMAFL